MKSDAVADKVSGARCLRFGVQVILATGGAGLIGSHFIIQCFKQT
jgi:hypothetical protein